MTTITDRTTTTGYGSTGHGSTGQRAFSAAQYEGNAQLFEAFYQHPFLRSLADGSASEASVLHYVGQDNQYLTAFMRCYGLGIAASADREWISWFNDHITFLLHDETHPHHVMCEAFGATYGQVQTEELAPNAQAYIHHLMVSAQDSLGVLMAALLPCPWTYIWAAQRQQRDEPVSADNPFAGWWEFYAGPECDALLAGFIERTDALAAGAGADERARMARAFRASCHHEIRFWQMAHTVQTWDDDVA